MHFLSKAAAFAGRFCLPCPETAAEVKQAELGV